MGMVFQQFNLFPHLTVMDNIILAPMCVQHIPVEEARKRALGLLNTVGLLDKEHAYPVQLSGGQQQRIAIARALCMQPELMLFDEPSLGLAPLIVSEIFAFFARFNKERGITMIIVEQNAKMALKIANRSYVLENGVITKEGNSAELQKDDYIVRAYLAGETAKN
jgi:ABC-type polar amino acid transport system ATPase subunit